jgi:hypothetical protein
MLPSYLAPGAIVRQNPETGRWFITLGMPGFNTPANNSRGYSTRNRAMAASAKCHEAGRKARGE